ncbi:hypothetical protein X975_03847, partial [Stegodyphus mimosarum]
MAAGSSLVILRTSLTARRYVDTTLHPIALTFMACHSGTISQKDNSRPHAARISLDFFVRLILFLGQQSQQTFHQLSMSGTW